MGFDVYLPGEALYRSGNVPELAKASGLGRLFIQADIGEIYLHEVIDELKQIDPNWGDFEFIGDLMLIPDVHLFEKTRGQIFKRVLKDWSKIQKLFGLNSKRQLRDSSLDFSILWEVPNNQLAALLAWANHRVEGKPVTVEQLKKSTIQEGEIQYPSDLQHLNHTDDLSDLAFQAITAVALSGEPLLIEHPGDGYSYDLTPSQLVFRIADHPLFCILAEAYGLREELLSRVFFIGPAHDCDLPQEGMMDAKTIENGMDFIRHMGRHIVPHWGSYKGATFSKQKMIQFGFHTSGSLEEIQTAYLECGLLFTNPSLYTVTGEYNGAEKTIECLRKLENPVATQLADYLFHEGSPPKAGPGLAVALEIFGGFETIPPSIADKLFALATLFFKKPLDS